MRLVVFLAAAIVIYFFVRWLLQQPPKARWQLAAVAVGIALVGLAATGRLHWLGAAFGALLLFARRLLGLVAYLPILQRIIGQYKTAQTGGNPSAGNKSTVQTRFVRMTLDHDTGEMDGEILDGQFKGKRLHELELEDLIKLHEECCNQDEESTALLQAYLNKVYGEQWQAGTETGNTNYSRAPSSNPGAISREEAYQILGLDSDASDEEIIEAHRRLMQKLHPDRGGSTYLAAKLNQAKDTLLS